MYANAKLWFTGGNNYFSIVNAIPLGTWTPNAASPWATNYMFLNALTSNGTVPSSYSGFEHGDTYFWITYDIYPGTEPGNNFDAEWLILTLSGLGYLYPSPQTWFGKRLIYTIPLGQ